MNVVVEGKLTELNEEVACQLGEVECTTVETRREVELGLGGGGAKEPLMR